MVSFFWYSWGKKGFFDSTSPPFKQLSIALSSDMIFLFTKSKESKYPTYHIMYNVQIAEKF